MPDKKQTQEIRRRIKFYKLAMWKNNPIDLAHLPPARCRKESIDAAELFTHISNLDFESRRVLNEDRTTARYIKVDRPMNTKKSLEFPIKGKIATIRYNGLPETIDADEKIDRLEIDDKKGLIETSHFVVFKETVHLNDVDVIEDYILGLEYNNHAPGQKGLSQFTRDLGGALVDGVEPLTLMWPDLEDKLDIIAEKGLKDVNIKLACGAHDALNRFDENVAQSFNLASKFAPSRSLEIGITNIDSEESAKILDQARHFLHIMNKDEKEAIKKFELISKKVHGEEEVVDISEPFIYSYEGIMRINKRTRAVDSRDAWNKVMGAYVEYNRSLNTALKNLRKDTNT